MGTIDSNASIPNKIDACFKNAKNRYMPDPYILKYESEGRLVT